MSNPRSVHILAGSPPAPKKSTIPRPLAKVNVLVAVLRNLASQDVARANAALAAIRIQNRLRQFDEVDAYLRQLAHDRKRTTDESGEQRAIG